MESKTIGILWIIFYVLFGIVMWLFFDLKLIDFVAYVLIIGFLFIYYSRWGLPKFTAFIFGLGILTHAIGMIPFTIGGEVVSLYHPYFFNGNYDLFTHFFGLFCFTLGFLKLLSTKFKFTKEIVLLIFLAMLGVGTLVEVSEFLGYSLFGFGWGAFAFGDGDNSRNFGPWGDSMTDTFGNLIGIILAFIVYFTLIYRRKKDKG